MLSDLARRGQGKVKKEAGVKGVEGKGCYIKEEEAAKGRPTQEKGARRSREGKIQGINPPPSPRRA